MTAESDGNKIHINFKKPEQKYISKQFLLIFEKYRRIVIIVYDRLTQSLYTSEDSTKTQVKKSAEKTAQKLHKIK